MGFRARSAEPGCARCIGHGHEWRAQPDAYGPGARLADRGAPGEELEPDRESAFLNGIPRYCATAPCSELTVQTVLCAIAAPCPGLTLQSAVPRSRVLC